MCAQVRYRLSALLCRYRANQHIEDATQQQRLSQWLRTHWTVDGPCFAAFPSVRCDREVREEHEARWGAPEGPEGR